uniref:Uncharacterized protein n=1 Tax=Brugia malayi TaxID=6279 RepID=A8NSE2_BRUMA
MIMEKVGIKKETDITSNTRRQ